MAKRRKSTEIVSEARAGLRLVADRPFPTYWTRPGECRPAPSITSSRPPIGKWATDRRARAGRRDAGGIWGRDPRPTVEGLDRQAWTRLFRAADPPPNAGILRRLGDSPDIIWQIRSLGEATGRSGSYRG